MRAASRLLYATHASARTTPLRPAPLALLPPIPLYRRLFRAHRHKLRPEERLLGDQYIRAEFRAHRNVDNPVHIVSLMWRALELGSQGPCRRVHVLRCFRFYWAGRFPHRVAAVCAGD